MRVGLVLPGFSADQDDWCIPALRHLVRELARTEDVTVFSTRYPYRAARYEVDGVSVVAIGGGTARGVRTGAVWSATLRAIQSAHAERRFDVLHAFWATESGLLASVAGRVLRVPVLVSLAGGELVQLSSIGYGDQRSAWERLKVRASLRLASRVSAGSRQLVRRACGVRADVAYAPLGVDTTLFRPAAASHSPPAAQQSASMAPPRHVLHVAALTPVKDQPTLLRAIAAVPLAHLDVAGEGALLPLLQHLRRELGLDARVRFLGAVDHAALPALYQSADAFVLSSVHEAQCMAVLEAAACGVPTVGTAVGVVPELPPEAAIAVAPGDPAALAEALRSLLDDSARLAELGQSARERVEREFTLEHCTGRFRALYAELAAT